MEMKFWNEGKLVCIFHAPMLSCGILFLLILVPVVISRLELRTLEILLCDFEGSDLMIEY